jgi:hypothetical protein
MLALPKPLAAFRRLDGNTTYVGVDALVGLGALGPDRQSD